MKQLLLVFLGGGAGSVLRYLVVRNLGNWNAIPIGTFTVNIVGSLVIGLIVGWAAKQEIIPENVTLLVATGFCGGFTTFSAFSLENQVLLKSGDLVNFGLYTAGSIFLGIAAVFLGLILVKWF